MCRARSAHARRGRHAGSRLHGGADATESKIFPSLAIDGIGVVALAATALLSIVPNARSICRSRLTTSFDMFRLRSADVVVRRSSPAQKPGSSSRSCFCWSGSCSKSPNCRARGRFNSGDVAASASGIIAGRAMRASRGCRTF